MHISETAVLVVIGWMLSIPAVIANFILIHTREPVAYTQFKLLVGAILTAGMLFFSVLPTGLVPVVAMAVPIAILGQTIYLALTQSNARKIKERRESR
jgi:hypothetical protein